LRKSGESSIDDLVTELIEHNSDFRSLLAKSLAGHREPFAFEGSN
jgi:hypothetical protein